MEFVFQFVSELLSSPQEEEDVSLVLHSIAGHVEDQEVDHSQNIFSLGEFH